MAVIRRSERRRAALAELPLDDPATAVVDARARTELVYELEQRFILPSGWTLTASLSALRSPGDYVTAFLGGEPVVVVHDRGGTRRALSNVCTHRASLVAQGSGNCGRNLVCAYHGWIFGLDGRLLGVPYRTGFAEIDQEALGLTTMQTAEWGPFVFVHPSAEPGEFGADPALGRELALLEWSDEQTIDVDVDWKRTVLTGLRDGVDEVLVNLFPATAVVAVGAQVIAQRWEPLGPDATRIHRWSAVRPTTASPAGTAPDAACDAWSRAYVDALVALAAT